MAILRVSRSLSIWPRSPSSALSALSGTSARTLLAHAIAGGRRDFSSIGSLRAGRYDVVAAADVAERAPQLLWELPVSKAA